MYHDPIGTALHLLDIFGDERCQIGTSAMDGSAQEAPSNGMFLAGRSDAHCGDGLFLRSGDSFALVPRSLTNSGEEAGSHDC